MCKDFYNFISKGIKSVINKIKEIYNNNRNGNKEKKVNITKDSDPV